VGRDGSSDAVSFLEAGIPVVEFGPEGAGHHGPDEWVSIASLDRHRRAIVDFVLELPDSLERQRSGELRALEGGAG
jgi:succinyl-diaminopimelate desuccinylase